MKGIKLCGECGNYDFKKHKRRIGCKDDGDAQASFYGDCPLPDVVPRELYDEVRANWQKIHDSYTADCVEHYNKGRSDAAREIFEEIEKYVEVALMNGHIETPILCIGHGTFAELKKKYTEGHDV